MMMEHNSYSDRECRAIQQLLPGHLDGTLSARMVWDVEKHLATCAECAAQVREMQSVIALLHDSERFDTSDDFMAKLHARLDGVEPGPVGIDTRIGAVRDWFAGAASAVFGRRTAILGMGMAAAALGLVLVFGTRIAGVHRTVSAPIAERVPTQVLMQNVVAAASNPFDDPVVANLEAETALKDSPPENNEEELN